MRLLAPSERAVSAFHLNHLKKYVIIILALQRIIEQYFLAPTISILYSALLFIYTHAIMFRKVSGVSMEPLVALVLKSTKYFDQKIEKIDTSLCLK